ELGPEVGLAGAAGAGARRIAALCHEVVEDAVEGDAVVEALLDQFADARDVARGEIGAHPDDDVAAGVESEDEGVEIVGHRLSLELGFLGSWVSWSLGGAARS